METVITFDLVIESADIHGLRYVVFREESSVHSCCYGARRIHLFNDIIHTTNHFNPVFRTLHRFFVENRPKDYARTVTVAAYLPLQLANIFG